MENEPVLSGKDNVISKKEWLKLISAASPEITGEQNGSIPADENTAALPEILFITPYPPLENGVSSYSHDLVKTLEKKFSQSFGIKICMVESVSKKHKYLPEVKYILNPSCPESYEELAGLINVNSQINLVVLQYELELFENNEKDLVQFLSKLTKPIVTVFHSVIAYPNAVIKENVQQIASSSDAMLVLTENSGKVLVNDYGLRKEKITVIPHGTHLVQHLDKDFLKNKYGLKNRRVLSTFGLLNSGKNIETTLEALPLVIKTSPDVIFLIIGKTRHSVLQQEGEKYRALLEEKVIELQLQENVRFINYYLPLTNLLEYLQLTDVYLFTSKDPSQAVNGTLSYAMGCGCPVISTPVPFASEILDNNSGIIIDFENPRMLSEAINRLLFDERLRKNISTESLFKMTTNSWENIAIQYARLYERLIDEKTTLRYNLPEVNFTHFKKLTTNFGMLRSADINQPDIDSGYVLCDNAMALLTMCKQYEFTREDSDIQYIRTYFNFIKHCLQTEGYFLNYVDHKGAFTGQNNTSNLADANGKAIWALGYLVSMRAVLPADLIESAETIMQQVLFKINTLYSTRAMAFTIKGLYYYNIDKKSTEISSVIKGLADRLVQMYKHTSEKSWEWFESYMANINSILPEALLCAYSATGDITYKNIAKASFDFLLTYTFTKDNVKISSEKKWLHKGEETSYGGEQPVELAYTILALAEFYERFNSKEYLCKMEKAFNWFLGDNHLRQVIYNPCTGGCYDTLEETHIDRNQGAASTVNYLLARLTVEKYLNRKSTATFAENINGNETKLLAVNDRPQGQKQVA